MFAVDPLSRRYSTRGDPADGRATPASRACPGPRLAHRRSPKSIGPPKITSSQFTLTARRGMWHRIPKHIPKCRYDDAPQINGLRKAKGIISQD